MRVSHSLTLSFTFVLVFNNVNIRAFKHAISLSADLHELLVELAEALADR